VGAVYHNLSIYPIGDAISALDDEPSALLELTGTKKVRGEKRDVTMADNADTASITSHSYSITAEPWTP